jgi:hypothetical protein
MRRKYFAFVYIVVGCALLWLGGCQGQGKIDNVDAAADPNAPQPKITFETQGHDFGEVSPNKLNRAQIKFTNTGEGVLFISKVARCCSVVATLDEEKKEYAPGESGAVNVEWRSGSQAIDFARELVVHSNDKTNPAAKLKLQAKIVMNITWDPARLKLFLDEENAGCPKITVRSLDNQTFSITGFTATGDCITADFDPTVEATKFVLEPIVDVEKLDTNLQGSVTIGLTHSDGNAAVFNFDVLPTYRVTPPLLILFYAEPNVPLIRKVTVTNNYKKDFEVESVSAKNGLVGIELLEQTKIRYGYQLQIAITPPPSEGKMRFVDEFLLGIKGGKKLSIRCNGYYNKKTRSVSAVQER